MAELDNTISRIPQETFVSYIVEKLTRSNPYLIQAFDESQRVQNGALVHIPNAGAPPHVEKNRKIFPATPHQREDSDVVYTLDVYSTDPVHVTWHETHEISYDKTDSVLSGSVSVLMNQIGDHMLYNWLRGYLKTDNGYSESTLGATNILRTTGALQDVNPNDHQSGQRKAVVADDIERMCALMDKNNVPRQGRFAIFEPYMLKQFTDSLSNNQMASYQQAVDVRNGIIGRYASFDIITRSSTIAFSPQNTPIDPSVTPTQDANLSALFWQKDCVTKAIGEIKAFSDIDNPMYYGNIYSFLVKMGGRARYADWTGIGALVQDAGE